MAEGNGRYTITPALLIQFITIATVIGSIGGSWYVMGDRIDTYRNEQQALARDVRELRSDIATAERTAAAAIVAAERAAAIAAAEARRELAVLTVRLEALRDTVIQMRKQGMLDDSQPQLQ